MNMKKWVHSACLIACLMLLSGCSIGDKSASMSIIYCTMGILSLGLLLGYICTVRKRSFWFILLYSSMAIVNLGYFSLSVSHVLDEALLANRLSYFGSVFLPMAMLMIILSVCEVRYKIWFPAILIALNFCVFFIAASPGYLDIYYKDVELIFVNGVAMLKKTYGAWHKIYLIFLLAYFSAIIATIIISIVRKKTKSHLNAGILASAVGINIGVWLMEQLVEVDFEFLSVSYVISGFFLLALNLLIQNENQDSKTAEQPQEQPPAVDQEKLMAPLTPTERIVCTLYFEGKSSREIMQQLCITENTLKYHNRNIYSKMGVSSRSELLALNTVQKNSLD